MKRNGRLGQYLTDEQFIELERLHKRANYWITNKHRTKDQESRAYCEERIKFWQQLRREKRGEFLKT